MAHLHQELSSATEDLEAKVAEWQGRCDTLEGQLQSQQSHEAELEQDLKARPTAQQVNSSCVEILPLNPTP